MISIAAALKKTFIRDIVVLLISMVILLVVFPIGGKIDLYLVQPWMDQSGKFIYRYHWLLTDINHQLFKQILLIVYLSFLVLWLASFKIKRLKVNRALYAYMFFVSALSTALVGLIKSQSSHACPWNMVQNSATGWIWDFSATQGHCFPGGHASTGFALITGYFVYRLSRPRRAYFFLAAGLLLGSILGWGQMMRGAHFFSHNLWTAWYIYALNSLMFIVFYRKLNQLSCSERESAV